jgi:hypothetical protein
MGMDLFKVLLEMCSAAGVCFTEWMISPGVISQAVSVRFLQVARRGIGLVAVGAPRQPFSNNLSSN